MIPESEQKNLNIYAKGIMADRIREFNWAGTSIGPIALWPGSLLNTVNLILDSGLPMFIWWGEEKIQFYNDPYLNILGTAINSKHPLALGQKGKDCWQESWPAINPLLEQVMQTGEPIYMEDQLFPMYRQGGFDDLYWSFSYNVIRYNYGLSGGILLVCTETTKKARSQLDLLAVNDKLAAANRAQLEINDKLNQARRELKQQTLAQQKERDLINEVGAVNEELSAANEELNKTISELAKTQEHLEENFKQLTLSEGRFQSLVRDASIGIIVTTGENTIVEIVNEAYARLIGRTVEELYQRPLFDIIPEAEKDFRSIIDQVRTTGLPVFFEEKPYLVYADGKKIEGYLNLVYQPFKNGDDTISGTMVLCQDVTGQVHAKKMLEENERRFRFMLDAIPQQVWTAHPDGSLGYVNFNVSNDLGKSTAKIIGEGWRDYVHPDDLNQALLAWEKSHISGTAFQVEFRLRFKTGEYQWHLCTALPLTEDDKVTLWIGTNTNIELQKRNEEKKDEFLSMASHELKTPLTSIKAFNQIMAKENDVRKMRKHIDKSARNIERLEKLVGDLLDVTKINAGKLVYHMQPFNFKEMIEECVDAMQTVEPDFQIVLKAAPDITYVGDEFRLEQVLNNVLSNAVKYSPKNKKIIVNAVVQNSSILVQVSDFGVGIPEESLSKLFSRYYRVDNTAPYFEGMGLGLFISSEILSRHGGGFSVESNEGVGSTFSFHLPL